MLEINKNDKIPLLILIIVNLLPIFGVFFLNWDVIDILFLYWFENFVLFTTNLLKMNNLKKNTKNKITIRRFYKYCSSLITIRRINDMIYFFSGNFGGLTLIHGVVIFVSFGLPSHYNWSLFLAMFSLTVSHFISYSRNFLKNDETKIGLATKLFLQPYKRLLPTHVAVILCALYISNSSKNYIGLFSLVILKIVIDAILHIIEHKKIKY